MDTLEICYMSAGDLSKLVESKEISPVEIIDAHLSRIDATCLLYTSDAADE